MAFWDDWQKNKNPITWSEGFQHGYKKIPKSSTPSSEELSLAKANKKLVGKEKLDESMQRTVQKVVKNMIKEGNTSGGFNKNKPRDLDKFNRKFMDVSGTADSNSYTITSRIKRPFPGREYAHKTIHNDGTVTVSYGPTPDPKDATDFIGKRSATKPTPDSVVKGATKPNITIQERTGRFIDPNRRFRHKLVYNDGSIAFAYGPTANPKDVTSFDDRVWPTDYTGPIDRETKWPAEYNSKLESKVKPTVGSAVKGATNTIDMEEFSRMLDEASDAEEFSRMLHGADDKTSTAKPEFKPKAEPKAKPTDGSEAFIKGVARSAKKISNGRNIDPTAEGSLRRMVSSLPNEAPRVDGTGVTKFETPPDEKAKASIESSNKKMSENHFKETSTKPTSNSAVKDSVWNKLKNSKAGNWLKNKVGSYFTDSPLTPQNVALTYKPLKGEVPIKGWRVGWRGIGPNPVAYAANAYGNGMGSGGYMPVGEHTVDQLRIQHGQDEVSSLDTVVPMNPQGTMYLDPKLGFQPTEVLEDYEGNRFYRNAQTGQFEPLDYNPRYSTYVPLPRVKKVYPTDSNGVPYLNDILGGVLSMPKSDTPLPIPPMVPPVSADGDEISSGKVVVGPDKEVKSIQPAQPMVKSLRRAPKPKLYVEPGVSINKPSVVNNTPAANVTPVQPPVTNTTPPVAAPTLSSVASQAVRHNGGFDDYRRQSVLSALRAAGGISPAEAVQRGIIPWEALNYI